MSTRPPLLNLIPLPLPLPPPQKKTPHTRRKIIHVYEFVNDKSPKPAHLSLNCH